MGSHVVKHLGESGHTVLVYDNLSKGHRQAVLYGELVVGDVGDGERFRRVVREFRPHVVMHFAAFIEVGESVRKPFKYYHNNFSKTIQMLNVMVEEGVRYFIFSSTAAVYGMPREIPIPESHPIEPINPYGASKAFVERVLMDMEVAHGLRFASLRYFNAAGADPHGRIGESHDPETHLIPLILKAAKGERESITIYGTDYPTPDGTAIRDYIHVEDLSKLHLLSMDYLVSSDSSLVINCGYGHGYSVREVIDMARRITGRDFEVVEGDRRPGDAPILVADNTRSLELLGWKPQYDDLEFILRTAWNWELNRRF